MILNSPACHSIGLRRTRRGRWSGLGLALASDYLIAASGTKFVAARPWMREVSASAGSCRAQWADDARDMILTSRVVQFG